MDNGLLQMDNGLQMDYCKMLTIGECGDGGKKHGSSLTFLLNIPISLNLL